MSFLLRTNRKHQLDSSAAACSSWTETAFNDSAQSGGSFESPARSVDGHVTPIDDDQPVSGSPSIEVTPDIGHIIQSSGIKESPSFEDWQFKKNER
jgi:hypothetical protein